MDGVPIHGQGENSTSRVEQIQQLRAHDMFCFRLVCRMKNTYYFFFVLDFSYSLSFLYFVFLPPSPIHRLALVTSPMVFFILRCVTNIKK